MKTNYLIIVTLVVIVIAIILLSPQKQVSGTLDSFAQCLAEKKVTMYGAQWCPHCQNQKKLFGDSFSFVPYVECPADPQKCIAAGIQGYPTWILENGTKFEGEQSLEKLSEVSSCPLPQAP